MGEAKKLDAGLEVALHLSNQPEADLRALRQTIEAAGPTIRTWLLFQEGHVTTPTGIAALARQQLGDYDPLAHFAGGTDAFFVQLNRDRPALDELDLLTYSLNPQVHAFDNASLVENLPAQAVTLASARQFSGGRELVVSPVTLKLRYNPASLHPKPDPPPGTLPLQVDVRQASLFGAGWTLGSIKYLSEGGAESVTYYETTGWLGVMERTDLPSTFDQFPSSAGEVFPLFHTLADVGEFAGAEVLRATSSDPLTVDGLALRRDGKTRLLLANFTPVAQSVDLSGIRGRMRVRALDEYSAAEAMADPEAFRARGGEAVSLVNEGLRLELAPFALARIDLMSNDKGE